ncbi:hypothetical protein ACLOJK_011704 [Asimina triloba]
MGIEVHRDRFKRLLGLSQWAYITKNEIEKQKMKFISYASALGSMMSAQLCVIERNRRTCPYDIKLYEGSHQPSHNKGRSAKKEGLALLKSRNDSFYEKDILVNSIVYVVREQDKLAKSAKHAYKRTSADGLLEVSTRSRVLRLRLHGWFRTRTVRREMWRSKVRHFLIRSSISKYQARIPSKTLNPIPSPSPKPSPEVFHAAPKFPRPRFFCHRPDLIDGESDSIGDNSTNPSSISDDLPAVFGQEAEKDDVFEEKLFSVPHESDYSSLNPGGGAERDGDFGEYPDGSSVGFADGAAEKTYVDGESRNLFLEEDTDGEQGEETVAEVREVDREQVESVLSVLQSSLDGPLESKLDELVLSVSEEFAVRVIRTPNILGENLIGFFRWISKKNEDFSVTTSVIDCLVRAVGEDCRKKDVYSLWDLIKDIGMKEKELLSTDILNCLISMFWKLGKGKAAFEVFNKFEELGCAHDADSYYWTIEALCRRSMFDAACSASEKMVNSGSLPDNDKVGKIITGLCKGSKAKDAHLVYLMAKENKKFPPRSSVNFLISKLCNDDGTVPLALELLEDFSGDARKYAIKPFTSVIRGLCRTQQVGEAKKLLFKMAESGPPPGNAVFNHVISGLSKAGEVEEAVSLMSVMEGRGLRPDVFTYNAIMSGYANGGQMDDACRIFSEAEQKHSKLSPITYHILIRGYCKLEDFDKALEYLAKMKEGGVKPNADEYNKLIQSLCLKALDWRTSNKLLEEMKENGLFLNGITRGLVKAVKDLEEEELQAGGSHIEA